MQTLRKKTSPLKYRNEPARFFGDGVVFKAKLIGILEVGEARGDRMCQEALQDLKIAIRAAGEHKQRITIHVTIEGLRLRDEKTGESLYHHPVHKISFIAQDMTDGRAFGYIFGSPDCGHRFFGIKTDKAASQVVLAMRDLFQCVFELKKKEIELAKQHIQNRITAHEHQQIKNTILEHKKSSLLSEARSTAKPEKSPETTANLVDLEQELSSIQRGITQMERITPNDDAPVKSQNVLDDDPFGDSFSFSSTPFNILPPPSAVSKRSQSKQGDDDDPMGNLSSIISKSSSTPPPPVPSYTQPSQSSLDSWLHNANSSSSIFKDTESSKFDDGLSKSNNKSFDDSNNANLSATKSELIDAFTDLDPLGTGKSKPYVDKKYFFQDLKNPPKKVLKDLTEQDSTFFDAHFSPQKRHIAKQALTLDTNFTNDSVQNSESTKMIDPFEEEDFSKINIDQIESSSKSISPNQKSIILPDTKISSIGDDRSQKHSDEKMNDYKSFNSDMPSDSWTTSSYSDLKRQGSDASTKNVFSVDAFSKKLPKPNLFGQRNVKRDSNGINMRRLQESDSLSENEPELPPRDSSEPPPLPPKNQRESSSEYGYDRNRYSRTPISRETSNSRYDYANKFKSHSSDSPPIPLPSRKINRSETSYTSKSSSKRSNDDDDYLTPNPTDSFPQLPPPPPQKNSSKYRGPRKSDTDPKNLDAPTPPTSRSDVASISASSILPDITLSQLLTLGIDDLAQKLNVPATKLNTMTLVELTTYLSDFIEKSKQLTTHVTSSSIETPPNESPVFKVSFDDAVFEAKFDDNFGEVNQSHQENTFVANFENFNQTPVSVIPTADRYAVFREIMDQEIQHHSLEGQHQESIESNNSNSLEEVQESPFDFARGFGSQFESPLDNTFKQSPVTTQASSNKITEALSGVKDRYAALRELRNIVLVEDLFDKNPKPPLASISDSNLSDDLADDASSFNQQVFETAEVADNNSLDNLPTYSVSWADAEDQDGGVSENVENQNQDDDEEQRKSNFISSTSNKDDLEIDEYMNKAISELSLDQRFSPNVQSKSPMKQDEEFISKQSPLPTELKKKYSPSLNQHPTAVASAAKFDKKGKELQTDVKNEILTKDEQKSQENDFANTIDEANRIEQIDDMREKTITPNNNNIKPVDSLESWAVFEQEDSTKPTRPENIQSINSNKHEQESGSSDGKREWKQREKEYHKRWPKPHTSSSSRDVSPWEDGPPPPSDHRKQRSQHHPHPPPAHYHSTERYSRPLGPPRRRMNSCEEDYDDEFEKRPTASRMRPSKPTIHRSKEILESENPNWYHAEQHWSYHPDDNDDDDRIDRTRPFDRSAYERTTYGPPYDKREPRSYQGYERRAGYDKRSKYYRSYNRPDYEYDPYDVPGGRSKSRKDYDEFEGGSFERGARETRSAREYFYDRDRRSFDSNESYESGRMHRMNSGELYGDYGRGDYRDGRHAAQPRMTRRNQRSRGAIDDDSDEAPRRPSGETGSLQRGYPRVKPSNIKLDDDVWGSGGKYWKQRPSSAAASAERMSGSGDLSGSDGDREKRHRRKARPGRGKEVELRSNYATIRYPGQQQPPPSRKEYYDFDDDNNYPVDEPSPASPSPRLRDGPETRDYYARNKHPNIRTSTTPRTENKSLTEYVKPRYPYDDGENENFDDDNRIHTKSQNFKKSTSKDIFLDDAKEHYSTNNKSNAVTYDEKDDEIHAKKQINVRRSEFSSEEQANQQHGNNKFAFDGFESDFTNTSPKQKNEQKSDTQKFTFEEREFSVSPNPSKNGSSSQQKLRFNENVSVSKFDKNLSSQQMFEDDFLQSWTPETQTPLTSGTTTTGGGGNTQMQSSLKKTPGSSLKTNVGFTRPDNLKKSDSVNIFARKSDEDPFANDDFFNAENEDKIEENDPFQWDNKNDFANFDENKNI